MAACASLIPTKVYAATLTVVPVGSLKKNPGDSIDFILAFNPQASVDKRIEFSRIEFDFDQDELSSAPGSPQQYIMPGTIVNFTTTVGRLSFNVIRPTKDGVNDVFARIFYDEIDVSLGTQVPRATLVAGGGDVEPVPEPLTIFGTATAIGCGILFKRKSFKKTVS